MVKPRLIILIRHAQSEGNRNRDIHQMVPDHRVKLTDEGRKQAEEAGRRLRSLLNPDDTLQIFTSPYRRTRETTEGILKTLTASEDSGDPSSPPSPFSRSKINVYEEPRLREQDFGNFQPCSAEMERMWAERADYGHFFYRIPNGESAADAYDRISGFNESLWRQFGTEKFPSVCVLVTHGLMTRVFLMKWYHWSVEYFEDLRNVNHCEFVLMRKSAENDKYMLENRLRTWSELKRQRIEEHREVRNDNHQPERRNTLSNFLTQQQQQAKSPEIPPRKWGGCGEGCNHDHDRFPRRTEERAKQAQDDFALPPASSSGENEGDDHPPQTVSNRKPKLKATGGLDGARDSQAMHPNVASPPRPIPSCLSPGRDGGGNGDATPHEEDEDARASYFATPQGRSLPDAMRKAPQRKATHEDLERWANESGMGVGTKADLLGDEAGLEDDAEEGDGVLASAQSGRQGQETLEEIREAERVDRSLRESVY